jgi:crotonobetainyl-CoA:carnitine CoA-transferase CaiB-like acyl-CoA transferase
MFKRWASLVDRADLVADPRFSDDMARGDNGAALSEIAAAWCSERNTQEALQALRHHRIPAAPVLALEKVFETPEVRDGRALSMQMYPGIRYPIPLVDPPARLEGHITAKPRPAPALGCDTFSILAELGLAADDIQRLRAAKVV